MNMIFLLGTIRFLWEEMYPIDKVAQPQWYARLEETSKSFKALCAKVEKEMREYHREQYQITKAVLDDYFKLV